MTPEQFERVEQLFEALCDLPESAHRAYLDIHCADDADVRERVTSMLASDRTTLPPFDTPILGASFNLDDFFNGSDDAATHALPSRIGKYTVLRKLGEGGMGVVLEARQDQPARHVAIKLVRDSLPSAESLRRFRREIELLGQLQHPGIAHIYDAGSFQLSNGAEQPYFVMEYIDGLPLNKYAETYGLSSSERLQLMATICDAVSFAHQRGILHRDLKPGNILVVGEGTEGWKGRGTEVLRHEGTKLKEANADVHTDVSGLNRLVKGDGAGQGDSAGQGGGSGDGDDVQRSKPDQEKPASRSHIAGNRPRTPGADPKSEQGHQVTKDHSSASPLRSKRRAYAPSSLRASNSATHSASHPIGQPKILDFGLGRLMDDSAHDATVQTRTGRMVGTLAYMSPEQIDGHTSQLDARSDVYSLGVILYELLSSHRPHELSGLSLAESARRIRDESPVNLSSIDRVFRGDISTIVNKALSKDRVRRYASAGDLAADIRRFLNDEPIMARPATAVYQMRKFARRHKALVTGGAIALVALLVAVAVSSRQALIATAARDEAQREAYKAKEINRFLQGIFSSEAFDGTLGGEVTAAALLDVASQRLSSGHFGDQPDVIAELNVTLGHSYLTLGRYASGQEHFESAHAIIADMPDAPALAARVFDGLGAAFELQNDYQKAEEFYRKASLRWEEAGGSLEHSWSVWPHGLPSILYRTGRYDEAEAHYRKALARSRERFDTNDIKIAQALSGLGSTLEAKSQLTEAIASHQKAADIYRAVQSDKSMHLANCLNNLGNAKQAKGDFAGAAAAQREALEIRRSIFKPDHPDVAMSLSNLGLVLMNLEEYEASERMHREALGIRQQALPGAHHSTAVTLNNLALTLVAMNRFDEALDYHTQAVEMAEQVVPEGHIMPVVLSANRAACLVKLGRTDEAKPILESCLQQLQQTVGPDHRRTIKVVQQLSELRNATNESP